MLWKPNWIILVGTCPLKLNGHAPHWNKLLLFQVHFRICYNLLYFCIVCCTAPLPYSQISWSKNTDPVIKSGSVPNWPNIHMQILFCVVTVTFFRQGDTYMIYLLLLFFNLVIVWSVKCKKMVKKSHHMPNKYPLYSKSRAEIINRLVFWQKLIWNNLIKWVLTHLFSHTINQNCQIFTVWLFNLL